MKTCRISYENASRTGVHILCTIEFLTLKRMIMHRIIWNNQFAVCCWNFKKKKEEEKKKDTGFGWRIEMKI